MFASNFPVQPPKAHPQRAASMDKDPENSRALAGMLLAASIAALLVAADQIIDICTDGHLLAGWVALWTLVFAGLALMASSLRRLAARAATLILQ